MPIRYYEGLEGAGKSAMMTRDLSLHHLAGGEVKTFPGYDLLDHDGNIISETLLPEQWVTLPDTLRKKKIAIGIDEVQNFFNNHVWYNKICDMMGGMMAQRRKFEIAILLTGPIFDRLPPVIKEMIHEVVHCQDLHTINHKYKRGERCIYYKEDRRGLISTPGHRFTRKKMFNIKRWWEYYDTYQAVDQMNQYIKVKFKAREIIIGPDGKVLNNETAIIDPDTMRRMIDNYNQPKVDKICERIKVVLESLKEKNIQRIDSSMIFKMLGAQTQGDIWKIGKRLKGTFKLTYDRVAKEYVMPEGMETPSIE